jgi:hypothetical protein
MLDELVKVPAKRQHIDPTTPYEPAIPTTNGEFDKF